MGLRLLVFDGTPKKGEGLLRAAWSSGAPLYRALGRVDAHHGATSWADALAWLTQFRQGEPISGIQYWGHGKWGTVFIANDVFTARALDAGHAHFEALAALRARMLPNAQSLVWFRTCETFGARAGHAFASRLSNFLGARVAGHTHVIGVLQSGLHGLHPGESPRWSDSEGLASGTPDAPVSAKGSSPDAPHTIHFMNNAVPDAWFAS
ncbi:DUF4347 domain-containing protein [Pendulispora rubella]|uniref:DUF4347 domain-containing protein n=1 Tax=Pendulispora rubella TaxID=2741070 RepID=A0ABZ2LH91_9BACT